MQRRQLRLNRETLRHLGERDLARANAGLRADGSDRDETCAICENTMPHGGCPGPLP